MRGPQTVPEQEGLVNFVDRLEPELTGQLIALVAHDLRNPLSALQSNVSFVASTVGISNPERQEALDDAGVSCEALAHIIDNMDVVSQFLVGKRPSSAVRISAGGVLGEVVNRFERLAQSHGVTLRNLRGSQGDDIFVRSNREMLSRALGNLVANSIQYGNSSVIQISVETKELTAVFSVSDKGSPVPVELREVVFTAKGQIMAKSNGVGRYSRGLGLFAAGLASEAAGAKVKASEFEGHNQFLLVVPLD